MTAHNAVQAPPLASHWLSGLVTQLPWLSKRIGNLETRLLAKRLEQVRVDRPIYITGLAKSGSKTLVDLFSSHVDVATHQYRDFPLLFTPHWWGESQAERGLKSKLFVTRKSAEPLEEMLWMAFFPQAHNPDFNQVLERQLLANEFARFYRDHIRKLLLLRKRRRYLANGNYNLTRIPWLAKQFGDARFVVVVRHPVQHIAALVKQHRFVSECQTRQRRALAHMRHLGQFEFGLDRRPINVDNTMQLREIRELWRSPERAVRGWAKYWAAVYDWVVERLTRDPRLRERLIVLRFEDLCQNPRGHVDNLLDHCELDMTPQISTWRKRMTAPRLHAPPPRFSDAEMTAIQEETEDVARELGYFFEGDVELFPETIEAEAALV